MRANFHSELMPLDKQSVYEIPYPFRGNLIKQPINRLMASFLFYKNRIANQTLENYVRFFYPLDQIRHWSKFYGKQGMYQFQCVIPYQHRLEGMQILLKQIQQSGLGGFVSVLKTFSKLTSPGLLSFPMHGVTLAVDFAANDSVRQLIASLTENVIEMGGRIYTAKDALMTAGSFQASYPGLKQFMVHRDPGMSSLQRNSLSFNTSIYAR